MALLQLRIIGDCRIDVGPREVNVTSSHLFALLLYLVLSESRRSTRADLHRLIFGAHRSQRRGDHRLRQLLYRLRSFGVPLDETALGVRLGFSPMPSPFSYLRALSASARATLGAADLAVLPGYSPQLSDAYANWVDQVRDELTVSLQEILRGDLSSLRDSHNWEALSCICAHIANHDPSDAYVARIQAEALAMLGRRDEALRTIDVFMREADDQGTIPDELRRLRRRVSSASGSTAREGTLVGRGDCMLLLAQEWLASHLGGARLLTLLGPPGIGKSRVLHEFAAGIIVSGGKVLQLKCASSSQQYPLSLFAQILPDLRAMRGSLGISPHHSALLDRLLPSPATANAVTSGIALELLRSDLLAAIVDLLEAVSAETPLLVTIDDAHLLDAPSCAVLRHLATAANSAAILFVTCWRPRDRVATLSDAPSRSSSYHLQPLDDADAFALLRELTPLEFHSPARTQWCLERSGGNPFYLHSLSRVASECSPFPFDITSLATALYFGLGERSRLVLESCLYLNTLATFSRLAAVTELDDLGLASALRELEALDLVSLQGSLVRGPHSLLDEALRAFIPLTVAALVHKRIATILTHECKADAFSVPIALAAARSWIAFGDLDAAEHLLRRCAADIASIGDPSTAADLLSLVAFSRPADERKSALLDDIIGYADAGGSRQLALQALRERLHVAGLQSHSTAVIRALQCRLIEAEVFSQPQLGESVRQLAMMLEQPELTDEQRLTCIVTSLIIADAQYDAELADRTARMLEAMAPGAASGSVTGLRAHLIYHTTFGNQQHALAIANALTERFPRPTINEECRTARRFASFALYRLLRHNQASDLLAQDYEYMSSRGIKSEAIYAASLLTEIDIAKGDFDSARAWFHKVENEVKGGIAYKLSPNSGYYSSAALFAMLAGDYARADELLAIPLTADPRMRTRRYEAVLTALRLRCAHLSGAMSASVALTERLRELHALGRSFGGQDTIVEMLWCADIYAGREKQASAFLETYLMHHRREIPSAEWSLRSTTSVDEVWRYAQPERAS